VKALYKDLVTVAKDPDSQEIKCFSQVFRIEAIGKHSLFTSKNPNHPQNAFYVVVDPVNWHVNLYCTKWEDYWE